MKKTEEAIQPAEHAALAVLATLDKGRAAIQLTDAQRSAVSALLDVADPKKPATVTLKLTYRVNDEGSVFVDYAVDAKLPKHATGIGFYYVNDQFDLVREDPSGGHDLKEMLND